METYHGNVGESLYLKGRGKSTKKNTAHKRAQEAEKSKRYKSVRMSKTSKSVLDDRDLKSMINGTYGQISETPKLAERTRVEYLEEMKKSTQNMTFQPELTGKTKEICKIRGTTTSDEEDKKVKQILFDVLHQDASEKEKRRENLSQMSSTVKECTF